MSRKGENIYKRKDERWEAGFISHDKNGNVTTTMNLYVHPTFLMKKRQMDLLTLSSFLPSK